MSIMIYLCIYNAEFPQREAIPEKEKSVVVYEKACKKYGIIISSSFLRGLKKGKVNVNNQGLGPLGAKAVALSLVVSLLHLLLDA